VKVKRSYPGGFLKPVLRAKPRGQRKKGVQAAE
jgi:hypothetical protein